MATRARKKISRMTYAEAKAEYDKLVSDGHSQMARTIHLQKYMASFK
jgi:hypothetical protein